MEFSIAVITADTTALNNRGLAYASIVSPDIIGMLVPGFLILTILVLWETLLATKPMSNTDLVKNRTVIGACLLDAPYQIANSCWSNHFSSFLQVVKDLSISQAGYVDGAFLVVSGLLMIVVDHQHVAAALALLNVAGTVGGALGATISGAIWAKVLPGPLARFLLPVDLPDLKDISDDLATQPSYVVGSPTRVAVLLICRRYVTDLSEIHSLSFTTFVILKIISRLLYFYVVENHRVLRRQCRAPFFGQESGVAALAAVSLLVIYRMGEINMGFVTL